MLWIENRDLGKLILSLTAIFFAYYTFWIIVLPFVDSEYEPQVAAFFPKVEIGLIVPAALGAFVLLILWARAYQLVQTDRALENKQL